MAGFQSPFEVPGIGSQVQTQEGQVWWGKEEQHWYGSLYIKSTATDAGNTPTTLLRAGLLLGKITATGELVPWAPTATDGSELIYMVLAQGVDMLTGATAKARWIGWGLVRGNAKAGSLVVPGNASAGISGDNYEFTIRRQLQPRFLLDDDYMACPFGGNIHTEVVAGNTTVVAADNNRIFLASAAAVFTLPAPRPGLRFRFFMLADANLTVTGHAADLIFTFNDIAATSVAFSTAGNKIGASVEIIGVYVAGAARWLAIPSGANTMTVA